MPVIGLDKKATEEAQRRIQEQYEAIKKDLDEIKLKLLADKDYPLSQRTSISYRAPIDLLITYPGLERQHSRESIESLKKSIETTGIINKPICTLDFDGVNAFTLPADGQTIPNNALFTVVCGSARIQAIKELREQNYIDILIKYMTPDDAFQMSLDENDEREDLNPIDRANQFKSWIEKTGVSQSEIARRRNKTSQWVNMTLKLLTLPKKVQELMRIGKVSFNQANLILQIDDADIQTRLAELCADGISENDLREKLRHAKLKTIPINAFTPPAPIESDITPPRPITPPSPKPSNIPETTKSKNDVEIIQGYIKDAIEKAIDVIKGKEDKYGKIFPKKLDAISMMVEKCNGDCKNCPYIKACIAFMNYLHQYYGISFPELADLTSKY
jgi:ParB/RepB/Spo0J family partition protein